VAARMAVTARARLGERFGIPALRDALTAAYVASSGSETSAAARSAVT
jgi:hypothetical protein